MFTTWDQVKSWIEDNNFPHWVFYTKKPDDRTEKSNDIIIDSNNYVVSDLADKLAMTEKYLRMYGGILYGVGFKTPNTTVGGTICTVNLAADQPVQGIGMQQNIQPFNIGELRESLSREIRATIEAENYRKEKAEFEKAKAQFEEEKQSALGALVHYFAPVGQMMLQNKLQMPMRQVAGVDADEPVVHAARIKPIDDPEQQEQETKEPEQESPFTDEEADKLFELMARFKKVEPQYMQLLEAVVTMAENGDATYNMAKGFLIK